MLEVDTWANLAVTQHIESPVVYVRLAQDQHSMDDFTSVYKLTGL